MSTSGSVDFDLVQWLLRLIAYIIDGVILFVVAAILGFVILLAFGFWVDVLIFGLLSLLYFIVLDVAWNGTIGKRLLGFRVQTVSGGRINYGQSVVRNISKIFLLFLFLDWLIGVLIPNHDKRQKWSDSLVGTVVVQIRSQFQASTPPSTTPPPPPPPPPPT